MQSANHQLESDWSAPDLTVMKMSNLVTTRGTTRRRIYIEEAGISVAAATILGSVGFGLLSQLPEELRINYIIAKLGIAELRSIRLTSRAARAAVDARLKKVVVDMPPTPATRAYMGIGFAGRCQSLVNLAINNTNHTMNTPKCRAFLAADLGPKLAAASRQLPLLHTLQLRRVMGTKDITALAQDGSWPSLEHLSVDAISIHDSNGDYAAALAALAAAAPQLRGLEVSLQHKLTDNVVYNLLASPWAGNLRTLSLEAKWRDPPGPAAIVAPTVGHAAGCLAGLTHLHQLRSLTVRVVGFPLSAMEAMATSPCLTQLTRLELNNCALLNPLITCLAASPTLLPSLTALILVNNLFDAEAASTLAAATGLQQLRELRMGCPTFKDGITPGMARVLAEGGRLRQLRVLEVGALGPSGWEEMMEVTRSGAWPLLERLVVSPLRPTWEQRLDLYAAAVKAWPRLDEASRRRLR